MLLILEEITPQQVQALGHAVTSINHSIPSLYQQDPKLTPQGTQSLQQRAFDALHSINNPVPGMSDQDYFFDVGRKINDLYMTVMNMYDSGQLKALGALRS